MARHIDMKAWQESEDRTTDPDFIAEHFDRLLAWDWLHVYMLAGRELAPWEIAERTGVTTDYVHEVLNGAKKRVGDAVL